ncbi:hypothetical protein P3X46_015207 [Hevea brasiliensis]|uniref:Major facilitator superfamily (MFS) profile domain-containing protein n=1 Tax=Hevea brasiliensis TaxID=3981 RepID=A0ABQ9LZ85_HEVBR|nr:hypothetical protein P3X46_015207 [Hevea brasiliensis]
MGIKEDIENGNDNANNGVHKEMREPLIGKNLADEEDGSREQNSNKQREWMVYFTTLVAVCGSFEFGCCVGYSSPTQDAITEDLSLSLADLCCMQHSIVGSILTFGAMIGAITSGPIADFIGRKRAMRASTAFCVAGWLFIYSKSLIQLNNSKNGALALDIGRLATGYRMGVFSYVLDSNVPVFIVEIAPKNLCRALRTLNQLMICSGVSFFYVIGTVLTWRALALTELIPCAILLFGLFLIPESPRWLAKMGREKHFEIALKTLRGKDMDISHDADEIKDYIETLERLPKAKLLDLFQRRYLRSVIIGVGMMAFQQIGGINGVCFYLSNNFESAGFSASVGTIASAIIQVVVSSLNTTVIDKGGRKPLLLVSASGLVISSIIIAISFYQKAISKLSDLANFFFPSVSLKYLTSICRIILSRNGCSSLGCNVRDNILNRTEILAIRLMIPTTTTTTTIITIIPFFLQIFPINIKGVGASLATLMNWFGAWTISYTYNFLMSWSSYGTFVLYAVVNALGILFVTKVVPETKGRTLEQIQAAIMHIETEQRSKDHHPLEINAIT